VYSLYTQTATVAAVVSTRLQTVPHITIIIISLAYPDGWRRSVVVSALASINVVNRYSARLVLGWVTVCKRVNHLGVQQVT